MIKAIETYYNGYRFRSRLEARWAVFFDALQIRYEYEKEGFEFGSGLRYLPDFWLPDLGIWIEIKGERPTEIEKKKAQELCSATSSLVYIFTDCYFPIARLICSKINKRTVMEEVLDSDIYQMYDWPNSYYQGWQTFMHYDFGQNQFRLGVLIESNDYHSAMHPNLINAYQAARSARFE